MRRAVLILTGWTACLGCQNDTPGFDPFMRRHYVPPPATGSFGPPAPGVAPYYPAPSVSSGVPALPPSTSMPPPAFNAPPAALPSSQPNYQAIPQPMPPGVPGFNSRASQSPPWPRPETAATLPRPLATAYSPVSYQSPDSADASGWRAAGGSPAPASNAIATERAVAIR